MTNKATRLIVKVVGEVRINVNYGNCYLTDLLLQLDPTSAIDSGSPGMLDEYLDEEEGDKQEPKSDAIGRVDAQHYKPYINEKEEWILSEVDLGKKSSHLRYNYKIK